MFVWSKRLVTAVLGLFVLMLGTILLNTTPEGTNSLKEHITDWIALN